MTKQCSICGETKEPDMFARSKSRVKVYCKACDAAAHRHYRAENPDHQKMLRRKRLANNPSLNRNYNLRSQYGITLGQWEQMFDRQGRRCLICHTDKPSGRGWQTDHDHKTEQLRGILCHHCNSLLGHAREDPGILGCAIHYLCKYSDLLDRPS